jgi:hypothetical protein
MSCTSSRGSEYGTSRRDLAPLKLRDLLLRVPLLALGPPRGRHAEPQHRRLVRRPGEDAIAGPQAGVELLGRKLLRRLGQDLRSAQRVERKAAEILAHMAPRVQIPVRAVPDEPLRADRAAANFAAGAAEIDDLELLSPQHRCAHDAEIILLHRPVARANDFETLVQLLLPELSGGQQRFDSSPERLQRLGQQPRVELPEQLLDHQQRVQLVARQPDARQLVRLAVRRGVVVIAALLPVVFDRRVQAVAHILDVALDAGAADFQLLHDSGQRRHPVVFQKAVNFVDSFGLAHGDPLDPAKPNRRHSNPTSSRERP